MPILTLQRSLREIGRIRIGQKTEKGYPTKLDRFRFTSADQTVIEAAAQLYGGTPQPWTGSPIGEQWELISDANKLTVIIPPGTAALSQWFELWDKGGCTRRCDGVTEVIGDRPCPCLEEDNRQCQATTRLSLVLADLPGLGVWRLESHGYYAATELAGTVDLCQQAAGRGQMLPAVLGLDNRQVKRRDEHGKPVTRNFVVPTLDVAVTPNTLAGTISTGRWQAIAAPDNGNPDPFPEGDMEAALHPAPTSPKPARSNAAAPIPATGLKPRPSAITTIEVNEGRKTAVDTGTDPDAAVLELRYGNRAKALTEARRIAKTKGWDMPAVFNDIAGNRDLVTELLQ